MCTISKISSAGQTAVAVHVVFFYGLAARPDEEPSRPPSGPNVGPEGPCAVTGGRRVDPPVSKL